MKIKTFNYPLTNHREYIKEYHISDDTLLYTKNNYALLEIIHTGIKNTHLLVSIKGLLETRDYIIQVLNLIGNMKVVVKRNTYNEGRLLVSTSAEYHDLNLELIFKYLGIQYLYSLKLLSDDNDYIVNIEGYFHNKETSTVDKISNYINFEKILTILFRCNKDTNISMIEAFLYTQVENTNRMDLCTHVRCLKDVSSASSKLGYVKAYVSIPNTKIIHECEYGIMKAIDKCHYSDNSVFKVLTCLYHSRYNPKDMVEESARIEHAGLVELAIKLAIKLELEFLNSTVNEIASDRNERGVRFVIENPDIEISAYLSNNELGFIDDSMEKYSRSGFTRSNLDFFTLFINILKTKLY